MKKYAMIQIDADVHQLLKDGLIETLVKEKVESSKKTPPKNVLPVVKN